MSKNGKNTKTAKRVHKLSLSKAFESGAIKPGQRVRAFYRDHEIVGFLRKDATIKLSAPTLPDIDNQVFGTISGAANAICAAAGKPTQRSGYYFFGTVVNGKTVRLADLCQ